MPVLPAFAPQGDDRAKAGVSHCKKVFSRESEAGNKQDEIEDLNTIWFKKSFYRCVIGSLRQSGSVHVPAVSYVQVAVAKNARCFNLTQLSIIGITRRPKLSFCKDHGVSRWFLQQMSGEL